MWVSHIIFFFKIDFFFFKICCFLAALSLCSYMWALSSCHEQGLPFVGCTLVEECILVVLFIMVPRFLDALASEVVVHGL